LDVPTSSTLDYFRVGLYDATSGALMNSYLTGSDKTFQTAVPGAGSYFLAIDVPSYNYSGSSYSVTANLVAGSVAGFESEPNNASTTADALTLGTSMTGQLSTSTDEDFYKITVSSAGTFSLIFDVPTNSSSEYFRLGLYDSAGNLLSLFSTGVDKTYTAAAPAAGTYYLAIDVPSYNYSGGAYNLTANHTPGGNNLEQEPNDDLANALFAGKQIRGQLSSNVDIDWFSLSVTQPGDLQIAFDAPTNSSSEYFKVWVLDSQGNVLAGRSTGMDISFSAGAPVAGNYFVAVTTSNGYAYTGDQYGLTVTPISSNVNRESEINDSTTAADPLLLSTAIVGQLSTASDIDIFAVTMSSAGTLTVNFDGPTSSTWSDYFQLTVLGPTGSLISTRNTGVDTAFDVKVTGAGTYFVKLSTANSYTYSGGEYRLVVSAVLEDPIPEGAITGTTLGDRLTGTEGNDLIYGLGGNDIINGGAGTDTVVFRAANANLNINSIGGLTAIRGDYAAGEHVLSVSRLWNVEKLKTWSGELSLNTTAITPILGTPQADRIIGTANDDLIDGLGGSDFIDGAAGNDTLALFGTRDSFDVITVAGITRIKGKADAAEYAGTTMKVIGVEALSFNKNQTLPLLVESANRLFGSVGSDVLRGTQDDDLIDGQGGSDTVDGGAGLDRLVFFGRFSDFTVIFPTNNSPEVVITGKANTAYAGQTVRASNVEFLAFADNPAVAISNPPRIVLSPSSTLVEEGGSPVALGVSLSVAPNDNVTVNFAGGTQISSSVSQVTFTPSNWNVVQTVNVQAFDDTVFEKQHIGTLTISVSTSDSLYQSVASSTATYTVSDNDTSNFGSVAGILWNDADKDGARGPEESYLVGWRVFDDVNRNGKLDAGEVNTLTDTSGRYRLDDLIPGTHIISARLETGWSPTFPSLNNSTASIIVNAPGSGEGTIGDVQSIDLSLVAASTIYTNLGKATNITEFFADPRFSSINGQGVSVVIIDSGFDLDHPAFGLDADSNGVADRIVYYYDFYAKGDSDVSTPNDHGTHVASIVGSSDSNYPGIAPGVNLIVLKVFEDKKDGPKAPSQDTLEALNWVVANASKYNVVAVNLSLGNGTFDKVPTNGFASTQFKALANAGVVVVSASGNDYFDNPIQGVSYPSSDPYSLSVGAVWASTGTYGPQTGKNDAIAFFSQRDDTESDIFAPGVSIFAAKNGGGYIGLSGTSMAAPEISGIVALSQELALRELGRRLSFEEIRSLLKSTGDPIVDGDDENDGSTPNTGLTFYRVDMLAMAEAILAMKPAVSHTVNITSGSLVDAKNFGFSSDAAVQGLATDDFIVGNDLGEIIFGGTGDDQIDGGGGDDVISGEAGDDQITPGVGNDTVDGGDGNDTVIYLGNRFAYTITFDSASATYTVSSLAEGTDIVTKAETFKFANSTVSAQYVINTTSPTIAISSSSFSLGPSQTATITFTLSESSSNFVAGDVTVNGGTLSNFAGSGTTYTAQFTPSANSTANGVISVPSGVFTNAAGNFNADGSDANNTITLAVDTVIPTIALSSAKSSLITGETTTLTFTLSEASTSFVASDVTVTGGTLSNFTGIGASYTALFTPTANSTTNGTVSIASGVFTDTAGNANADGSDSNNTITLAVDTVIPTITLSSAKSSLITGETTTLTFTLSEASTSFVASDVTVTGGTLSNFTGSGTTYTALFTPTANSTTIGTVSVRSGVFTDTAGNFNTDGSDANNTITIAVDTVVPTIALSSAKSSLIASDTTSLTFTLSESSSNFAVSDVAVTGGTLSNFSGSGTTYTALFTPTANSTASGVISVASGVFTDAAGNTNPDGADTNNLLILEIDTLLPTIAVSSNKSSLQGGDSATLTFTLSEASNNFVGADVVVFGGTLSNFAGSGTSYSATFTLIANSAVTGALTVSNGVFTDAAGNKNADGSDANNSVSFARIPTITNETHTLSVIVDKNVLGPDAVLLKGLKESMTITNGAITKHIVEYAGSTFDYDQIDSLITTVTRDDEFTAEFTKEINDYLNYELNIPFTVAVKLIGAASIDGVILSVAGSDGKFVE
jgi:Ca2+-binding RTX toxin-like protein